MMPVTTLSAEMLGIRLKELGIATPEQMDAVRREILDTQERVSSVLTRQGILRDPEIGRRLATQLGALPQPIKALPKRQPVRSNVPPEMWRAHRMVPVAHVDGKLYLATDDPLSVFASELFGRLCSASPEVILVRQEDYELLLDAHKMGTDSSQSEISPQKLNEAHLSAPDKDGSSEPIKTSLKQFVSKPPMPKPLYKKQPPDTEMAKRISEPKPEQKQGTISASESSGTDDDPIVKLVDSMMHEAVRLRASDIHIEPGRNSLRVRYRIDGVLHDVNQPPKALQGTMVSRVKIMAGLNIAEKRLPQDGRMQLIVDGNPLDVRLSTLPAMHGESVVMRLLDRGQSLRSLSDLGLMQDDQDRWQEVIEQPHGMILVTGPTGSGKTTTLYGALQTLNKPEKKIVTVEDPIEYQLTGVNQVLVKSAIGLTFAAGLRSMLRQAPDVIMVGEIRDQETAQVAVQAALTGHMVLSTLHTNDAASAITRLVDMGVAPFLVASTVQGVLAQRLVRKICQDCRITDNATAEEQAFLGEPPIQQVIHGNGCNSCRDSGFRGRIGIFEMLVMSDTIRQLTLDKASASAIGAQSKKDGARSLRDDGCLKVREGLTTAAEVLRVAGDIDG